MLFNAVALSQGSELALGPLREWIAQVRGIAINPETLGLFPAVSCAARLPTLKQAEEQIINQALRLAKDNQSQAAKLLGITRQALTRRLLGKQRRAKA